MNKAIRTKFNNKVHLTDYLEAVLSSHNVEQTLSDDLWEFRTEGNGDISITLDFTIFDAQFMNGETPVKIVYKASELVIERKLFAKLLFLEITPLGKSRQIKDKTFKLISHLFYYFANTHNHSSFGLGDLERVFENVIMYDLRANGLKKRFSPRGYQTSSLPFEKIGVYFKRYSVFDIFPRITRKNVDEALSNVCMNVLGITKSDYKKGGSFNFLGLDIGKHYVDHCGSFFEENIQISLALRATLDEAHSTFDYTNIYVRDEAVIEVVARALSGESIDEFMNNTRRKTTDENTIRRPKAETIRQRTYEAFTKNYNKYSLICTITRLYVIDEIIFKAKLPHRFDTQEFIRSLLIATHLDDFGKPADSIFAEYASALRSEQSSFCLTFDEMYNVCNEVLKTHTNTITEDTCQAFLAAYFSSKNIVGLSLNVSNKAKHGVRLVSRLISHVESAGLLCFVAQTGWRRSEFGFPFSAIHVCKNSDVLDGLYTPWRFNVKWVVPKTHGESKVDREITSHSYFIAKLLDLFNKDDRNPALYRVRGDSLQQAHLSQAPVNNRVAMMWHHFIRHYDGFNDSTGTELSEIRDLLRDGLDRYDALIGANKNKALKRNLTQYKAGSAHPDFVEFIEKYIPSDILQQLKADEQSITSADILFITGELLSGLPYPTPHSFRHMWAEAVLTRYRGDIGKFIRANFKHLDERFFATYLRDKETKAVYDIAQRAFINNVTRHHIKASMNDDGVFAGGLHRFINKAVKLTHIVSLSEEEKLTEALSKMIVNTKANRWSTCFLRKGTEKKAKCAVDGIPQRQNASPRFCLGCINADITESNFNGIVLSIKSDVDVCRNMKLPTYIKAPHIEVVELALKQVKVLRSKSGNNIKYDSYISHLEASLELASHHKESDNVK
ncbi:hypothetical protein [Litorivivens sp.]|uniref:hypothetical protein n=1 Tax=Litorivivens sp. TaxID=2020868 RepID=UPI003564E36E